MSSQEIKAETTTPLHHHKKVHHILTHSYFVYFVLFLIGFSLDLVFPVKIFENLAFVFVGVTISFLASILIFWAQNTSRTLKKENLTKEDFLRGPYNYTRSPTHLGLFLLILGFGIISNALFVVLFTVISFYVTKFTFLKKQEQILIQKYGAPYIEYGKLVKF